MDGRTGCSRSDWPADATAAMMPFRFRPGAAEGGGVGDLRIKNDDPSRCSSVVPALSFPVQSTSSVPAFGYSQKNYHISDGNLYSILSPFQSRRSTSRPSFLRGHTAVATAVSTSEPTVPSLASGRKWRWKLQFHNQEFPKTDSETNHIPASTPPMSQQEGASCQKTGIKIPVSHLKTQLQLPVSSVHQTPAESSSRRGQSSAGASSTRASPGWPQSPEADVIRGPNPGIASHSKGDRGFCSPKPAFTHDHAFNEHPGGQREQRRYSTDRPSSPTDGRFNRTFKNGASKLDDYFDEDFPFRQSRCDSDADLFERIKRETKKEFSSQRTSSRLNESLFSSRTSGSPELDSPLKKRSGNRRASAVLDELGDFFQEYPFATSSSSSFKGFPFDDDDDSFLKRKVGSRTRNLKSDFGVSSDPFERSREIIDDFRSRVFREREDLFSKADSFDRRSRRTPGFEQCMDTDYPDSILDLSSTRKKRERREDVSNDDDPINRFSDRLRGYPSDKMRNLRHRLFTTDSSSISTSDEWAEDMNDEGNSPLNLCMADLRKQADDLRAKMRLRKEPSSDVLGNDLKSFLKEEPCSDSEDEGFGGSAIGVPTRKKKKERAFSGEYPDCSTEDSSNISLRHRYHESYSPSVDSLMSEQSSLFDDTSSNPPSNSGILTTAEHILDLTTKLEPQTGKPHTETNCALDSKLVPPKTENTKEWTSMMEAAMTKSPPPPISEMLSNMSIKDEDLMEKYYSARNQLLQTHPQMFYVEGILNEQFLSAMQGKGNSMLYPVKQQTSLSEPPSPLQDRHRLDTEYPSPSPATAPNSPNMSPNIASPVTQSHTYPNIAASAQAALAKAASFGDSSTLHRGSSLVLQQQELPAAGVMPFLRKRPRASKSTTADASAGGATKQKTRQPRGGNVTKSNHLPNDISICKFRLIKGVQPMLEQKKSFYVPGPSRTSKDQKPLPSSRSASNLPTFSDVSFIPSVTITTSASSPSIPKQVASPVITITPIGDTVLPPGISETPLQPSAQNPLTVVNSVIPSISITSPIGANPLTPTTQPVTPSREPFKTYKFHIGSEEDIERKLKLNSGGGGISKQRLRRRSRKAVAREKLEATFRDQGFLIKTQQVSSAEGAVYCKFRQLRKFTRYLYKSWKDYLPKELEEAPGEAGSMERPEGTLSPMSLPSPIGDSGSTLVPLRSLSGSALEIPHEGNALSRNKSF